MQLLPLSLLTILTTLYLLTTTATATPLRTPPRRQTPPNPFIWHVTNFTTGCSPAGCVYNFNIAGQGTRNTPGFNTTCSGTDLHNDYQLCKDIHIRSILTPEVYPTWNITVQHAWVTGENAEFWAVGQANVSAGTGDFVIAVSKEYGVA